MEITDRQSEIMARARAEGRVLVDDLADAFAVTTQTIRRDLNALCQDGLLARVHGGAVLASHVSNLAYAERRLMGLAEKRAIGRRAAEMIGDGSTVSINIGTTTEQVATALRETRDLMVVTNNINVANILSDQADKQVILAGGVVRRADGAIVGDEAVAFMRRFKTDVAVIGASALDRDGSILDFDVREVAVSRAIVANARRVILVCDNEKFDRVAAVRICDLTEIDVFVTDRAPPAGFAAACARAEVAIKLADPLPMDEDDG